MAAARNRPPRRILVVDDDVDARLLMAAMIESHFEAKVVLVASVGEAVESVARVIPDLVITDGLMPGGDGVELIGRLRRMPRAAGIPVIVATASDESDFHGRLRAAGALAVLPKPPSPDSLAQAIGDAFAAGGG